jgi:phenylalanyl-tRNA synthetase beta chain
VEANVWPFSVSCVTAIVKSFDIDSDVFFADINWQVLRAAVRKLTIHYAELSKFPAVRRDLALLLDKSVSFAQVEEIAYATERKCLKEVKLFDVYEGKGLEEGKKSYAVCFILQDENQTLNDKAIDKIMSRLVTNLTEKLGAKLR